jgi:hypothetical protein
VQINGIQSFDRLAASATYNPGVLARNFKAQRGKEKGGQTRGKEMKTPHPPTNVPGDVGTSFGLSRCCPAVKTRQNLIPPLRLGEALQDRDQTTGVLNHQRKKGQGGF